MFVFVLTHIKKTMQRIHMELIKVVAYREFGGRTIRINGK